MRRDLCNALLQRHPRIFANPKGHGDAAGDLETRVGDGWYTLLDVLNTDLQYETDQEDAPQVHATQIKEKFGRLRFRVNQASDRQRAMIHLAESLSERLCEICGRPAEELSILEHSPRCKGPRPKSQTPGNQSSTRQLAKLWASLLRRWNRAFGPPPYSTNLVATMDLFEAIREEDIEGVRDALQRRASLRGIATYRDGCYSPMTLAQKIDNHKIVALLKEQKGSSHDTDQPNCSCVSRRG